MDKKYKLGIIGGGNMARAIVLGALKSGLLTSKEIIVSDKVNEQLICFQGLGIDTITDNKAVASSCEYLLFAIKPQQSQAVFSEIKDCSFENAVSIMAGVTISKIRDSLGNKNIARVMPNTPALVGMGMSAIAFSDGFKSDFLLSLFSSFGKTVVLEEKYFDAVTAVSGSGPAYVYMFIKSMVDAGAALGLDRETAKYLTVQTFAGAAKMVEDSPFDIETLINNVCSKGGTTIQAVESFRDDGLEEIIKKGMEKCYNRSKELSQA